jgi:hypothetical protein
MIVDLQKASCDMYKYIWHIFSKLDIEENRREAKFLEFSSLLFTVTFTNGFYPPGAKRV